MWLAAYMKGTEPRATAPAIGRIRLGTRDRSIHPSNNTFELVWDVGPYIYLLRLTPPEGGRLTEAQFREVVGGFVWP